MPRLGIHLSIAGGLTHALAGAEKLGCQCLQMFVRNQRQWKAKPLTEAQVNQWLAARARLDLAPVVVHDNYLINLASPEARTAARSYEALRDELDRCHWLDIEYLVMHPGSDCGHGEADGVARLIEALDRLTDERPDLRTQVLLETTAGQGSSLGARFEQIEEVLSRVAKPDFFGVCLDTCHVFAAGYDLRTAEAVGQTIDQFDSIIGLLRLRAVHVNDSKRELGSRVDRHEHIGLGEIGEDGFRALLAEPRLADLPMILETPKGTDPETGRDWDEINLETLRRLAKPAAKSAAKSAPVKKQLQKK